MTSVSKLVLYLCTALVFAAGCAKEDKPAPVADKPKPPEAKPIEAPKPPEPKPMTGEERAKWYQGCWDAFNKKDWARFEQCYSESAETEDVDSGMPVFKGRAASVERAKTYTSAFPDLTGEPQLILVKGDWVFSIVLIRGTHTGPMKTPMGEVPPTNKKVGYLGAHVVQMSDKGAVKDMFFVDTGTTMAQLGLSPMPARPVIEQGWAEKPIVVAADDQKEKDNVAVHKAGVDAFNKRDAKAFEALLADDVVWSEAALPADFDKKAALAAMGEMSKAFSDMAITMDQSVGIGDWVVGIGSISGTNDGDMPSMKLKKTGKKVTLRFIEFQKIEGGKIKGDWLFYNGMAMAAQLGMLPTGEEKPKGK